MENDKLSNLHGKDQERIVEERIQNTKTLHKLAITTNNPIVKDVACLDLLAKSMGIHIEYSEELDDEDIY